MNLVELQRKLIAAARVHPPEDRVPFAFEKRITALLAARAVADKRASWSHGLWRAAASCVAVTLLLGAWAFFTPANPGGSNDLSQDFENTLLASVDPGDQTP